MSKKLKIIIAAALIVGIVVGILLFSTYKKIYSENIFIKDTQYLYIRKGADFKEVTDSLYKNFDVKDKTMFEFVANRKNYPSKIRPGRYKIPDKSSNNSLINLLRSGEQSPVKVNLDNLHTVQQLCAKVSKQIDIDSVKLLTLLQDDDFLKDYGFDKNTCAAMFLPDTYQFYWNTSEEKFIEKIYSYYKQFWTENRLKKASQINLSPIEVSILASIVQKEQAQFKDEQPIIAALYLNRLKIGMPLQSCPTLIFAIGDYSIKRVTSKILALDSPFNTYKHTGLPPSPICFPEKSAIDAVLNPDNNDYIFMCAKSDFSGRHNFSKSYEDQKRFARDYQKALDRIGIHNEY